MQLNSIKLCNASTASTGLGQERGSEKYILFVYAGIMHDSKHGRCMTIGKRKEGMMSNCECPHCGIKLLVKRIEKLPKQRERATCPLCGTALSPREGKYLLQYSLALRPITRT
jgi:hypothetical protein